MEEGKLPTKKVDNYVIFPSMAKYMQYSTVLYITKNKHILYTKQKLPHPVAIQYITTK
jgi:hypothetical protein